MNNNPSPSRTKRLELRFSPEKGMYINYQEKANRKVQENTGDEDCSPVEKGKRCSAKSEYGFNFPDSYFITESCCNTDWLNLFIKNYIGSYKTVCFDGMNYIFHGLSSDNKRKLCSKIKKAVSAQHHALVFHHHFDYGVCIPPCEQQNLDGYELVIFSNIESSTYVSLRGHIIERLLKKKPFILCGDLERRSIEIILGSEVLKLIQKEDSTNFIHLT